MRVLKRIIDTVLVGYVISVLVYTCVKWQELNTGYPITAWVLTFLGILVSGRVLLYFSYKLRLPIVVMFRLLYFLMTNIWAIVGVIFYIKANEDSKLDQIYKAVMIISIIICFIISFMLRRGSLRIPYRRNEANRQLVAQQPLIINAPRRNYSAIKTWIEKFKGKETENCAVCCEEFIRNKKIVKLPSCGHLFHKDCIQQWVKVKPICPICKGDLSGYF